jgi:hypothetical protein
MILRNNIVIFMRAYKNKNIGVLYARVVYIAFLLIDTLLKKYIHIYDMNIDSQR